MVFEGGGRRVDLKTHKFLCFNLKWHFIFKKKAICFQKADLNLHLKTIPSRIFYVEEQRITQCTFSSWKIFAITSCLSTGDFRGQIVLTNSRQQFFPIFLKYVVHFYKCRYLFCSLENLDMLFSLITLFCCFSINTHIVQSG